jgi:hypothetical protein
MMDQNRSTDPVPSDLKRHAPATERNRTAILQVLRQVLPSSGTVLEIASGTGEHAVFFSRHLPGLVWQPSDLDAASRDSIAAWATEASIATLRPPLELDVQQPLSAWPLQHADAVVCINMIHIAPWSAALGLLAGAAALLPAAGPLCLYGPFKRGGGHTAPSNQAFDEDLQRRNPDWGVRDLETVCESAGAAGFREPDIFEMPANNLSVVFRRR